MASKRKTGVLPLQSLGISSDHLLPRLAQAAHDELIPVRQVLVEALKPTTLVILLCPPSATLPVFLPRLLAVLVVLLPLELSLCLSLW